jgi:hypothetical protein
VRTSVRDCPRLGLRPLPPRAGQREPDGRARGRDWRSTSSASLTRSKSRYWNSGLPLLGLGCSMRYLGDLEDEEAPVDVLPGVMPSRLKEE